MIRKTFLLVCLSVILFPSALLAGDALVIKAADHPQGGGLTIAATDAIVFDTSGHVFSPAHGKAFGPADTIAIHYMGDEVRGYYSLPYKSDAPVVKLDAASLTPRKSPPFPGYEPGATVFLMVGREFPEGSLDMGVFADQWILNVRVER